MIQRIFLRNAVEQVLHVQGNYRGGILEMAMVFDCNLPLDTVKPLAQETVSALKQQGEIFRNVRLNTIQWKADGVLEKAVTAMPFIQTGSFFSEYEQRMEKKRAELLLEQLKKFYARSKLILILTDGNYRIEDEKLLQESLKPFLGKKIVFLYADTEANTVEISRALKN